MRSSVFFLALLAPAGCGLGPQCGSTQGFVFGDVTGAIASPVGVFAMRDGGDTILEAEVAGDGSYELNLEGGFDYTIWAEDAEGCASVDHDLAVDECEEYELDLQIVDTDCVTADKPNLYLHPAVDTETTVRLVHDPRQSVFASDPPYVDGWSGVAHPDGRFTPEGGETAPFLFYEITLRPEQLHGMQRDEVHCLDGAGAVAQMAELLGAYGFDARQQRDFVDAWQADLPPRDRYAVYPQTAVDHAVSLDIDPPLPVHRLWLLVEDGGGCVQTAAPPAAFDRAGAHGVEWGVVLRGL